MIFNIESAINSDLWQLNGKGDECRHIFKCDDSFVAYYRPNGKCDHSLKNGDTWWLDIVAVSQSGDKTDICPFTEGEWISAGDKSGKFFVLKIILSRSHVDDAVF